MAGLSGQVAAIQPSLAIADSEPGAAGVNTSGSGQHRVSSAFISFKSIEIDAPVQRLQQAC